MPGFMTSGAVLLGVVSSLFYFGLLPRIGQDVPAGVKPIVERSMTTCKLLHQIPDSTENLVTCSCGAGYFFTTEQSGRRVCGDINECRAFRRICGEAECVNTDGSFVCKCPRGYALIVRTIDDIICIDVNECDTLAGATCEPDGECVNTNGSYTCNCNVGFILGIFGITCIDEDECLGHTTCPPTGDCVNTYGSYTCHCHRGYELLVRDGTTCNDANECDLYKEMDVCGGHGQCINIIGSYTCQCEEGFEIGWEDSGEPGCLDKDECESGNTCHPGICINIVGSYTCDCPMGYIVYQFILCIDLNECNEVSISVFCGIKYVLRDAPGTALGPGYCVNTQPIIGVRYYCQCHPGFINGELGTCIDVDECSSPGICPYCLFCDNIYGGYECEAGTGFETNLRRTACDDINECSRYPHICGDEDPNAKCSNTLGSYICICGRGFLLDQDLYQCKDIDECDVERYNPELIVCPSSLQICRNGVGVYTCVCKPPYSQDLNDINGCIPKKSMCGTIVCDDGYDCVRTIGLGGGICVRHGLANMTAINARDILPLGLIT